MSNASAAEPTKIELRAIHGLYGGHDLILRNNGEMLSRIVQPDKEGFTEERYRDTIQFTEIVKSLLLDDLKKYKETERMGIPDEVRIYVNIQMSEGKMLRYSKWEQDQNKLFDGTYQALLTLVNAKKGKLEYHGPLDEKFIE